MVLNLFLVLLPLLAVPAISASNFSQMNEAEIETAVKAAHDSIPRPGERMEKISGYFIGIPYVLGPLGEGVNGEFDKDPLFSFKSLDCTTFVEEAMAFALHPRYSDAIARLQQIRYKNGVIDYFSRNHFTEADWIPNNVSAGHIEDITAKIAGTELRTITKTVDKAAWYRGKTINDIQGFGDMPETEKQKLVERMKERGSHYPPQKVDLPYIPLAALPRVAGNIPTGTIVNFVRASHDDRPTIISHQGLIIDKDGVKVLRHASSSHRRIEDTPLLELVGGQTGGTWPLIGLNFQELRAQ